MVRVSVLLCFVLFVAFTVVINVSFANDEVNSKQLKSHENGDTQKREKAGEIGMKKNDDHDHDNDGDSDDDDDDNDQKGHDHHKKGDHDDDDSDDDDDDDDDKKDHEHRKKGGYDDDDDSDDDDDDDDHDHDDKRDHDHDDKRGHKEKKKGGQHDGANDNDNDSDGDGDDDDDHDDNDKNGDEDADNDDQKDKLGSYELKKGNLTIKFTNWGASIISVLFPDKHGKLGDIVLGYDSVKDYTNDKVYFGATVGRVANRIGKAQFNLDGQQFKTVANDGHNTLHGGRKGFSDVAWTVSRHKHDGEKPHLTFTYISPDGDQGFPGELEVSITYSLKGTNELSVEMKAKPENKATPVNLAQHSYWNLGGHDSGDILSEQVQIFGSNYTPVDSELIPTGKIEPVKGTPYDFLELRPIKDKISELPTGYDINYCLDGEAKKTKKAAVVVDKKSGRKMELFTNQLGLQFYTGGMLKDVKGKNGMVYKAHAGLCLETQGYPNAVNYHNFPSQLIQPGKHYKNKMLFKFSIVS